jgi:hypothetical protein
MIFLLEDYNFSYNSINYKAILHLYMFSTNGQIAVFAGLLVSMKYLGFEKVEHGLGLLDIILTDAFFFIATILLFIFYLIFVQKWLGFYVQG